MGGVRLERCHGCVRPAVNGSDADPPRRRANLRPMETPDGVCEHPGCGVPVHTDGRASCGGRQDPSALGCGRNVCADHQLWVKLGESRYVGVCPSCKSDHDAGRLPRAEPRPTV